MNTLREIKCEATMDETPKTPRNRMTESRPDWAVCLLRSPMWGEVQDLVLTGSKSSWVDFENMIIFGERGHRS